MSELKICKNGFSLSEPYLLFLFAVSGSSQSSEGSPCKSFKAGCREVSMKIRR